MFKQHYSDSTTLMVSGVPVTVKQLRHGADQMFPRLVALVIKLAQDALKRVLPHLTTQAQQQNGVLNAIYQRCFLRAPNEADISTIKSVLTTLDRSLNKAFTVKITQGVFSNYVNTYYSQVPVLVNNMVFRDQGRFLRSGDIHIAVKTLKMGVRYASITFIHEALHKFLFLLDYDTKGYLKMDGSGYQEPGLTWQEALYNADSYSIFVIQQAEALYPQLVGQVGEGSSF